MPPLRSVKTVVERMKNLGTYVVCMIQVSNSLWCVCAIVVLVVGLIFDIVSMGFAVLVLFFKNLVSHILQGTLIGGHSIGAST